MTIGAYYQYQPLAPINGLGQEQTMEDVAAVAMQDALVKAYPVGIFVPWATELSEGQWQDVVSPENRYALYPVTASQLETVEKAAMGQPVGFVAALSQRLLSMTEADQLFEGTPYEYFQTQGIFNEQDQAETPRVSYLYWGQLRDEDKRVGSYATLARQASGASVTLVYPVTLPIEGVARQQPWTQFAVAASTEQGEATQQAAQASASTGLGKKILFVGIAAAVGYAAYRWMKTR